VKVIEPKIHSKTEVKINEKYEVVPQIEQKVVYEPVAGPIPKAVVTDRFI
jgi:hypothetical protein